MILSNIIAKSNLLLPYQCTNLYPKSTPLWQYIGVGIGSLGTLYLTRKFFAMRREARIRNKWKEAEARGEVVLHQFWMGKLCPHLSPLVAKVDCFLRIYGIKYVRDISKPFGPNNLCPWITFQGKDISDSQIIAEHLAQHFGLDLYPNLSRERIATLEAARIMMEEHIYWILYLQRYYYDKSRGFVETQSFPRKYLRYFFLYIMPWQAYNRAKKTGVPLIPQDRQFELVRRSLDYLDAILGENKYFGGLQPCLADCSLFGFLMQLVWNAPGSPFEAMMEDFPRLKEYCNAMREKVYPDWDKILVPPRA